MKLQELKVGDTVIRWVGVNAFEGLGCPVVKGIVTGVTDDRIIVGNYQFCRQTGVMIDGHGKRNSACVIRCD